MGIWLRVRQGLAVMDLVMKSWGVALGLSTAEVTVLMIVRAHGTLRGSALATVSGRRRQDTHRTVRRLERRGVLQVTQRAPRGKSHDWGLTAAGEETARRLEERMAMWEAMLGQPEELSALAERLARVVKSAVNRPDGGNGWAQGLAVPEELRRYPAWDDEALKALVRKEVEALRDARVPGDPGPQRGERGPAGPADQGKDAEAAAWAAADEALQAMWR